MASRHACGSFSLASCSARPRRLFSRAIPAAWTSRPRRSSKARGVASACCCWSVHAAASASSLRAWSFSSVGAVRIGAPSLVVVPATEMLVDRREGELRGGRGGREPIEAVLEDRVDVAVGARVDRAGAGAGGFEPLGAVALGQAQDPEARTIALLGMRAIRENRLDQRGGVRADGVSPVDEARGRPFEVVLMRLRHVRGIGGGLAAGGPPRIDRKSVV